MTSWRRSTAEHPATEGHGIYVVLWFGEPAKARSHGAGSPPASAGELQQWLEAEIAKQLLPEQARKIAVRVIDVTKP